MALIPFEQLTIITITARISTNANLWKAKVVLVVIQKWRLQCLQPQRLREARKQTSWRIPQCGQQTSRILLGLPQRWAFKRWKAFSSVAQKIAVNNVEPLRISLWCTRHSRLAKRQTQKNRPLENLKSTQSVCASNTILPTRNLWKLI